jgi:hypothetical protein
MDCSTFSGIIRILYSIKRIVFLDFIHCLVSQEQTKLEKIKNYRQKIKTQIDQNTHIHKQITQGLITNHRATYLGAHTTHKPLKPVKHRWQCVTQPLHKS